MTKLIIPSFDEPQYKEVTNKCKICKGKGRQLIHFDTLQYVRELNRSKEIRLPAFIDCKWCRGYGFTG